MPWVLDEIIQAEVDRLKRLRALVDDMPPTNVTLVGDVVLDPFMGTGTTAVVAKALGRQYIGFDQVEDYVQTAMERVEKGPYVKELQKEAEKSKTDWIKFEEESS